MADNRPPTYEEMISWQFINMVLQTSNMAMMFLGKLAHPETGKATVDLEAARMFIDQLEMLHVKTKGNLSSEEQKVLADSLTSLRLMFVETANAENKKATEAKPVEQGTAQASPTSVDQTQPNANTGPDVEAEDKKKFVKKY